MSTWGHSMSAASVVSSWLQSDNDSIGGGGEVGSGEQASGKFDSESALIGVNLSELLASSGGGFDFDPISLANITALYESTYRTQNNVRNLLVIVAYSVIFFISLFGNLMVCHIIVTNRKLHTFTNCFIANLSVSDLLMTVINVPFGVARLLLDDWPFGNALCKCLPFIQATSVYVSTITMCIISIDRYCVVVHPLGPRITNVVPLGVVLAVIWLVSCALAIPFALYNEVTSMNIIVRTVVRCRAIYPSADYDKALTALAFLTQYLVPLTIASIAYSSIAFHIKQRSKLGAMTREQIGRILKTNRQTITMLVLVLIVFAICWLPLHLFHLYRDFLNSNLYNTEVFLTAHWLAMSSICYNPFIYSARNKHFRNGMKNFFRYLVIKRRDSGQGSLNGCSTMGDSATTGTQLTSLPSTRFRSSYLCKLNRNQTCSRSFCLQRVDDCVRSSSSSLEEPTTANNENGNGTAVLPNGKQCTLEQQIVSANRANFGKLSLPLISTGWRESTIADINPLQAPVLTTTASTNGSSRIDSCQVEMSKQALNHSSYNNVSLLSQYSVPDCVLSPSRCDQMRKCNTMVNEMLTVESIVADSGKPAREQTDTGQQWQQRRVISTTNTNTNSTEESNV